MPARQPGPVPGCRAGLMRLSAVGAFAPAGKKGDDTTAKIESPMPFGCGRFRAKRQKTPPFNPTARHQCLSAVGAFAPPENCSTTKPRQSHQCLSAVGAFAPEAQIWRAQKEKLESPMPFGCGRFRALTMRLAPLLVATASPMPFGCGRFRAIRWHVQCLENMRVTNAFRLWALSRQRPQSCPQLQRQGHQCLSAVGAFAPSPDSL